MTLDEAIDKMMTCGTTHVCPSDEVCFTIFKWAQDQRKEERLAELMKSSAQEPIDEIINYAPEIPASWEFARPDWDAC